MPAYKRSTAFTRWPDSPFQSKLDLQLLAFFNSQRVGSLLQIGCLKLVLDLQQPRFHPSFWNFRKRKLLLPTGKFFILTFRTGKMSRWIKIWIGKHHYGTLKPKRAYWTLKSTTWSTGLRWATPRSPKITFSVLENYRTKQKCNSTGKAKPPSSNSNLLHPFSLSKNSPVLRSYPQMGSIS